MYVPNDSAIQRVLDSWLLFVLKVSAVEEVHANLPHAYVVSWHVWMGKLWAPVAVMKLALQPSDTASRDRRVLTVAVSPHAILQVKCRLM